MILPRASRFLGVALVCLAAVCRANAETTWTEVQSPHFRVLTDGSAQQGRDVAAQFEQMRHVFAIAFKDSDIRSGPPLTIVAARDAGTFKALEPHAWKATKGNLAGEFHRGWEKQFATVILDSWGDQKQIVVFHEYTHSVVHARAHWLPIWMDEGMAEFYAYTRFESGRTLVGAPSIRMQVLQNRALLPVSEMLDTEDEAKLIRDDIKAQMFYAEAWAMVHYMMFGKGMGHGEKLHAFFRKLQDGEPEKDAFKDVFGDPHAFETALDGYVRSFTLQAGVFPADEKVNAKSFPARPLTPAETEYELGTFQIGAHEAVLGRQRIEKAVALDSNLAGAQEELGFLDFREGKDEEAVKEWQRAVDLDPARSRSLFALAMSASPLAAQSVSQLQATKGALQHVIDLSPDFAPAYVEMGLVDWRLGQMTPAFKDVSTAERLEPWRAGYHILAGHILLAGNQPAAAARYARYVAERWAGPDHNEAVDLWNDIPASYRGEGSALSLEIPAGAKLERGTLTALTCGKAPGEPMVLTLTPDQPGEEPLTLQVNGRFSIGFSDSFWWGEDHFTTCHHLTGHAAVVAYRAEDKRLVDLEARDDLPAAAGGTVSTWSGGTSNVH
jgi:tetratricopeptide (TPR) repeat protein